ncbi:oxalate:formate antiporter [Priestia taiwanensis]|uniref:Oxalate:formate antiporter n=1 Tax=Priestia taiwanensis TaxID=1347902 RepID=A0A917AK61_9BACI|nr:oxalate:formate antiporter [Priestia taiwanensis]MBM7361892.1 hypothetical protein [Priestia taiwanensis]GGE57788.1 hypothetical protein GCM10007140_05200 [Priestia taiwanensis]
MADLEDLSDIIYINGDRHNQCYTTTGITFEEFSSSLVCPLKNVLLLKHRFEWADFNLMSRFDYVEQENVARLMDDDVHEYGEFCWVDFEDSSDLDELEPSEIASLLYLGHMKEPLNKAFFPILNNTYAYLSEEDGRYTKVYYKKLYDFLFMLCNVIPLKLSDSQKRKMFFFQRPKQLSSISIHVMEALLPIMEEGMIIDLSKKVDTRKAIEIPIYKIQSGRESMEFFTYEEKYSKISSIYGKLVYMKKEQQWRLES